jgi:hypothetical protein
VQAPETKETETTITADNLKSIEVHKDGSVIVNTVDGQSIKASSITVAFKNGAEVQTLTAFKADEGGFTFSRLQLASGQLSLRSFGSYTEDEKSKVIERCDAFG